MLKPEHFSFKNILFVTMVLVVLTVMFSPNREKNTSGVEQYRKEKEEINTFLDDFFTEWGGEPLSESVNTRLHHETKIDGFFFATALTQTEFTNSEKSQEEIIKTLAERNITIYLNGCLFEGEEAVHMINGLYELLLELDQKQEASKL